MNGYKWTANGKDEAKQDWLNEFTGTVRCGVAALADDFFCAALGLFIIEDHLLSDALTEAGIQLEGESLDDAIAKLTESQQQLIKRLTTPDDLDAQWEARFG